MFSLEAFKVDLNAVKEKGMTLTYNLDDDYFKAIDGSEVNSGAVHVVVSVVKSSGIYELSFHCEGTVKVQCDRCLDEMNLPISTDDRLFAKLGDEYKEDEDIVTVERETGVLDIAWFIYEFIALGVPAKHVHEEGECNSEMMEILNKHSAKDAETENNEAAIDPRWSELEKIKTIIKD